VYFSQYPGRYDLRLGEYVARRIGRLKRKDFIPRSESYGDKPEIRALLNEVRANLRLELEQARLEARSSAWVAHGILITGPKYAAKKSVLWDAMRQDLRGWTFVTWPHHMDHPADLAQRLGYRIVLWVEHLSDYASPGEAAALSAFIQQALDRGKHVIVLASCRDGKSLQVAQRYFAPLMDQLRRIKTSKPFPALVTYSPTIPDQTDDEQTDVDRRIDVLKAMGIAAQSSDLPTVERELRVKNQLAVLRALRWLKDAGALTFPDKVVQLFARYFGFEEASESGWKEAIEALGHPDHEFVRTAERAKATERLTSAPPSFLERRIIRPLRGHVQTDTVLIPTNVFNLPLDNKSFRLASKSLEKEATSVIDQLKRLEDIAIETLILLGDSYLSEQRGDERAASVRAAACYTAAWDLLKEEGRSTSFHTAWAATLLGRGNAALHQAQLRHGKDRDEHLANAAEMFRTLLASANTLTNLPALSAQAYHGLGDIENAYATTDYAHAETRLQEAATQYRTALTLLSPLDLFWNETQLDLANALRAIARSDSSQSMAKLTRMQCIQGARDAYAKALHLYSRETSPAVWAEIQRCLADLHLLEAEEEFHSAPGEAQQDMAPKLANAVGHIQGHYFAALTVFSPAYLRLNWARVQFGLAKAFFLEANTRKASSPDGADASFDRASEALAASEEVLSLLDMPLDWVETRLLRGRIALEKYRLKPIENEGEQQVKIQAIEVCKEVLKDMRRVIRRPSDVATPYASATFTPSVQQERRLKLLEDDLADLEKLSP
jgi:hypothetical protein